MFECLEVCFVDASVYRLKKTPALADLTPLRNVILQFSVYLCEA